MKLIIKNVTRAYKSKIAIDDVTCELTPGVYGLIGPNGAGKTTLMRMLADVLKPTRGEITVNGESIRVLDERYRDLLGYLPQDCGFYSYFTACRFLQYMSSLKGINKREADKKIDELLQLVNLSEQKHQKISKFSGGMKRRLGIAQALLNDPKILILDEPTAGLDPKERVRFRNLLSDISEDRIVILSTHIISDIEYMAKEVLILKHGRLVKQEAPETILQELDGKVWHITAPASELARLTQSYIIGNLQRRGYEIEARVIADHKPQDLASLQPPRLEDIYLYYFGDSPDVEG
ncbi:ABC transporter ATP-binding protein [Paenibacillus eucommiae]|uniref:ABC-type multidrug transport system ATPase subunit n=1 Tax=Paenibacillus eucommiae TaxID=1355755 RepID=A0ABS4J7W1_9BACL|nr:ABC transporter ATP-binding protein [Paenibacillus eucommiae]MBP1995171.1 ABC-type multidrug transport system ATPase subunit [Paenibacillus eucommiae]